MSINYISRQFFLILQRVTDTTHDEETVCACSKSGGKKLKLAKKRPKLFRSERGPTGYFVISGLWASLYISKYYPGSVDISHQCWVNFGVSKTRLHRWFIRCTKTTGTKCHCETNSRDTHMAFIWTNQNAAAIHSQGNTYERVTISCWGQMTQKNESKFKTFVSLIQHGGCDIMLRHRHREPSWCLLSLRQSCCI